MTFFKSVALMFSMFTRIPASRVDWSGENMRYVMCALPLAGVVIGLFLSGWIWACSLLHVGTILFAVGITLIPVAVTGGIHLDGFCDTLDALASRAPMQRKREILKDPHTGAFAVIGSSAYLLLYFGLASEVPQTMRAVFPLMLLHGMSRILTGLLVLYYPPFAGNGLLVAFQSSAFRKRSGLVLLLLLAVCAAALLLPDWRSGAGMMLAALLCALYVYRMSRRQFGGASGDIAGFLLQVCEISMLMAYVLIQKAVAL